MKNEVHLTRNLLGAMARLPHLAGDLVLVGMRTLGAILAFGFISADAGVAETYTGFWKGSCSDGFGVQIKPVGGDLYSVSFCGPGGCFEPGTWKPNTKLQGDPTYRLFSSTQLGIKRSDTDDYFTYTKCTDDPTWLVAAPEPVPAEDTLDCSLSISPDTNELLIAWITGVRETTQFGPRSDSETTTVESFRPIAALSGSKLRETAGTGIHKGQHFWRALSPSSKSIRLRSAAAFLDHMNVDHCVAYGTLESDLPEFTLLTSRPLAGVFRMPTAREKRAFAQLDSSCVDQGDYPEGEAPPCTRPTLLAVTDLNRDGKPEYWATEPYKWDTGLTVWENKGSWARIFQVCVGCSD